MFNVVSVYVQHPCLCHSFIEKERLVVVTTNIVSNKNTRNDFLVHD